MTADISVIVVDMADGELVDRAGGPDDAAALGQVLTGLATAPRRDGGDGYQTMANFLDKTTGVIDPAAVIHAMNNFARAGDLTGVETILAKTNDTTFASLTAGSMNQTLVDIASNFVQDMNATNRVVGTFLDRAGHAASGDAIVNVINEFALSGNFVGIENILARTSSQTFAATDAASLGQTLIYIGGNAGQNAVATNNAVSDFLAQTSGVIDRGAVVTVMDSFAKHGNLAGVDAMLGKTEAISFATISAHALGQTLIDISKNLTRDFEHTNKTVADFMEKTDGQVGSHALFYVMNNFALNGNFTGLDNLLTNSSSTSYANTSSVNLNQTLSNIAVNVANDYDNTNKAVNDFLAKVGGNIDHGAAVKIIGEFGLNNNFSASSPMIQEPGALPPSMPPGANDNSSNSDLSNLVNNNNPLQSHIDHFLQGGGTSTTGHASSYATSSVLQPMHDGHLIDLSAHHHLTT